MTGGRSRLVATALLVGAAMLGGCGGDDDADTSGESDAAAARAADAEPTTTTAPGPVETAGGVLPVVDGVTDAQRADALALIEATDAAIAQYADTSAAEAAGYRSIGDGITGFEHYVNRDFVANATVLQPAEVESLVYRVEVDGTRTLVSGMYILPNGSSMDDVPDIAGPLTTWHDHQNLCWDPDDPARLAGILIDGECFPGGVFRGTAPMLHVWVEPHECGPFAGIEGRLPGTGHGESCAAAHAHTEGNAHPG